MDKETQDLIIQLMEKLDSQMQPTEDDLAERLPGKYSKKPMPIAAIKVTKVEDMPEEMEEMGDPGNEAEALQKRLKRLKGC